MIVIVRTFWTIVGLVAISASCGDGGSFAPVLPEDQSPSGVWRGPFTSTTNVAVYPVTGLVSEDNDAQFLASVISQRHYSGNVAVNAAALTGTLNVYRGREGPFVGFDGVQSIVLNGTASERDGLFGDYTGADDEGRFNLNYDRIYEDGSSLDLVRGLWIYTEASAGGALYTVTLDIDANGTVFGSDTEGCVYSGQLSIIDSDFNSYRATVSVSTCIMNIRNIGNYTGLAYLSSIGDGQVSQLTMGVSKTNRAFAVLLQRL